MTRVRARARPRIRSVDFSRLGWLLATEAAYRIVTYYHPWRGEWDERRYYAQNFLRLGHMRRHAREDLVYYGEVIL